MSEAYKKLKKDQKQVHRTISVREETYKRLLVLFGRLQIERMEAQSFDSTITYLLDAVKEKEH